MERDRESTRWDPMTEMDLPNPVGSVINGEWVSADGRRLPVEDPATGKVVAEVHEASDQLLDDAVDSAYRCFNSVWGRMSGIERGRILTRIAAAIREDAEDLATVESVDTGKPVAQARADVEVAARYFEYYAGTADKIQGDTIPQGPTALAYTVREPLGVVAHITPWNSPLNQMSRGVAPSLATGNTVVVKPSAVAPLSSVVAARLFVAAGLPAGACNVVLGRGPTVGMLLVQHPLVRHLSFTGSVVTGREVLRLAAEKLMPCNLELGGKSPTIVLADANLAAAAHAGAMAVVRNSGQSCFATTRLLVHRSVHNEFVSLLVDEVSGLRIGHGLDDVDVGPLASARQLARVSDCVDNAREEGAVVAVGGATPEATGDGFFYSPTVLVSVTNSMRVAREEVFGPVQTVLTFDTEDEAVAIANDSPYGLAAGVFTNSLSAAHRIAGQLHAGQVHINRYPLGSVETPFGGHGQSGMGREKGLEALRHYTQLKTILVSLEP